MSYVPFAYGFENPRGETTVYPSLRVAVLFLKTYYGSEEILKDPSRFPITEHLEYRRNDGNPVTIDESHIQERPVQIDRYLDKRCLGLKEAKDLVDAAFQHLSWCTDPQLKQFYSLIRDRKISTIKLIRETAPPVYTFKELPL